MTITSGSIVAGRHGAGTVAESTHTILKLQVEREQDWAWLGLLKP